MYGVPGVIQDPVKTGEHFDYRLKLRDAGTYWYHPHLNGSEQYRRQNNSPELPLGFTAFISAPHHRYSPVVSPLYDCELFSRCS